MAYQKATEYNGPLVRVDDVTKTFQLGKKVKPVHALYSVTLDIPTGQYVSIMGPSGSGKTTLFNMIGALDKPTKGVVYLEGIDISRLDESQLAWIRCNKIGYIFQNFNIIPVMTALENVTLPMTFYGLRSREADEKAMYKLGLVGLTDRAKHKPLELSGGQQQRVAIARALANDPSIVLADEPTGNLDLTTGKDIIELLKKLQREQGVTVITNTHDEKMIDVSDRIVWLEDGMVARDEKRENVAISVGTLEGKTV